MQVKRALVTGAGKRLGRAMALYLGDRGFDVAVHYSSSAEGAEEVVARIKANGCKAVSLQADLLDDQATANLVSRASDALDGPLSVLINNASIFEHDTVTTATEEAWNRHIGSNLKAPFFLTQAFARQIAEATKTEDGERSDGGLVVNMLDQRVLKLTPEFSTYTIAKMGLWAFTRTAAQGLAPHIRVNAIGPGPTLQGAQQSKDHFSRQRASTLLERGPNPADITAALGYLLDAPTVTGQLICVDGGQHLNWQSTDILGVE